MAFKLTGKMRGYPTTIAWTEKDGFVEDPADEMYFRIMRGIEVAATHTGPFFLAADRPEYVAYLTAFQAFDDFGRDVKIEDGEDARRQIEDMCRVPEGAIP